MHFFNPVLLMKLLELIPALQTSNRTIEIAKKLAERMDKTIVVS